MSLEGGVLERGCGLIQQQSGGSQRYGIIAYSTRSFFNYFFLDEQITGSQLVFIQGPEPMTTIIYHTKMSLKPKSEMNKHCHEMHRLKNIAKGHRLNKKTDFYYVLIVSGFS